MTDSTGKIDRPVAAAAYFLPFECWTDAGSVVWASKDDEEGPFIRYPNGSLLDDFLRAPRDEFTLQDFVSRWGPLQLKHSILRWLQGNNPTADSDKAWRFLCTFLGQDVPDNKTVYSEPAVYYTALSQNFQDILNLSAEIYADKLDEDEWLRRFPYHCEDCKCGIEGARDAVQTGVKTLLDMGAVSFGLDWKRDQWQVEVCFPSLLGALATKLMLAVARADGLYVCSGCGDAYIRSAQNSISRTANNETRRRRAPRPGERNYCSNCGASRSRMDAKRTYREKQRKAIELMNKGVPVEEIAVVLKTDPARVSKWRKIGGNK